MSDPVVYSTTGEQPASDDEQAMQRRAARRRLAGLDQHARRQLEKLAADHRNVETGYFDVGQPEAERMAHELGYLTASVEFVLAAFGLREEPKP